MNNYFDDTVLLGANLSWAYQYHDIFIWFGCNLITKNISAEAILEESSQRISGECCAVDDLKDLDPNEMLVKYYQKTKNTFFTKVEFLANQEQWHANTLRYSINMIRRWHPRYYDEDLDMLDFHINRSCGAQCNLDYYCRKKVYWVELGINNHKLEPYLSSVRIFQCNDKSVRIGYWCPKAEKYFSLETLDRVGKQRLKKVCGFW